MAVPAVLVIAVGSQYRASHDDFVFPTLTKRSHDAIQAYVVPVRNAEAALQAAGPAVTPGDPVRNVVDDWIRRSERGELVPLPPAPWEDTSNEGPSGQAIRAASQLAFASQQLAKQAVARGDAEAAAQDLLRSVQVAQILKYSDFNTIAMFGIYQRRAVDQLREISPKLSPETRRTIASKVAPMSEKSMIWLVDRAYTMRERLAALSEEDQEGGVRQAGPLLASRSPEVMTGNSRRRITKSADDSTLRSLGALVATFQK